MLRLLQDVVSGTCFWRTNFILALKIFDESRYFASGTGAAGLVGALLWWELRNLGVRVGVGLSSVRPFEFFAVLF